MSDKYPNRRIAEVDGSTKTAEITADDVEWVETLGGPCCFDRVKFHLTWEAQKRIGRCAPIITGKHQQWELRETGKTEIWID